MRTTSSIVGETGFFSVAMLVGATWDGLEPTRDRVSGDFFAANPRGPAVLILGATVPKLGPALHS